MTNRPSIGLALGGGSHFGVAHIGVIAVLEREGLRPDYIAGTSAGAMVAAAYASGVSVPEMRRLAERLSWKSLQKAIFPRLALTNNEPLGTFLRKVMPVTRFEDLQIPLRVVTTDLVTGEMVVFEGGPAFERKGLVTEPDIVFETGDLVEAVRAGCARPVISLPVRIGDRLLVDGFLANNVPARLVRDMGADVVVAVDLHAKPAPSTAPRNIIQYALQSNTIFVYWAVRRGRIWADVVAQPDLRDVRRSDFSQAQLTIRKGEEAMEEKLPLLRTCLAKNMPADT